MTENFEKLTEYVHDKYSIPYNKLRPESEIEKDLKITGDDAVEFIDDIFNQFNIRCDRFNYNRYFDPEGFGLINFTKIANIFTKKAKQPIIKHKLTLGHIEQAIRAGIWREL